jgi:hypothetical protein
MTDPRAYSAGTRAGLFALGRGTCYFPNCDRPVVEMVGSEPEIALQIAHIHGASLGSARYEAGMTDAERASFSNLILLCTPHHNVVDRRHPEDYPAEVLRAWKTDHEGVAGVPPLPVTESTLLDAIRDAVEHAKPQREVKIEFHAALLTPEGPFGGPFQAVAQMRASPDLERASRLLVTTIRNSGGLPSVVEAVDLHFALTVAPGQTAPGDIVMLGRNDVPKMNADLPHRLLVGDAMHWYLSAGTIAAVPDGIRRSGAEATIHRVFARVRLATGEVIDSENVSWTDVAAAGFPVHGSATHRDRADAATNEPPKGSHG